MDLSYLSNLYTSENYTCITNAKMWQKYYGQSFIYKTVQVTLLKQSMSFILILCSLFPLKE